MPKASVERSAPIIIPVEVASRELDAKLLLACLAAARGRPAILGCRFDLDLRADQVPRGIRLEKGITDASYKMFRNLRDLGYVLAAWDEEALVYYSDHAYAETRLSKRSMALLHLLLAWGEDNRRLWREARQYSGTPIVVTGNARVDLLRPEFRALHERSAAEIRDAFGDFILINSNFGSVNFYDQKRETKFDRYVAKHTATALKSHRIGLFQAFLDILPVIAKAFPDHKIVVRPHPAEDHRPWIAAGRDLPNVLVVQSGPVHPWLAATAALIHNGCTTAIEALLLGVPAIAYRPLISAECDIRLPNDVSHVAHDEAELLALLRARLSGRLDDQAIVAGSEATLSNSISSYRGPLACQRILDAVEGLPLPSLSSMPLQMRRQLRQLKMRRRRRRKLKHLSRKIGSRLNAFRQRSFPDLTVADISDRIGALRKAWPALPEVTVAEMHKNIFSLTAAKGRRR